MLHPKLELVTIFRTRMLSGPEPCSFCAVFENKKEVINHTARSRTMRQDPGGPETLTVSRSLVLAPLRLYNVCDVVTRHSHHHYKVIHFHFQFKFFNRRAAL